MPILSKDEANQILKKVIGFSKADGIEASLNGNDSNNNNAWIRLDFGAPVGLQSVKWQGAGGSPHPAWSPTNMSVGVILCSISRSPMNITCHDRP